jgi:CubicO group peptidase (beta-lactamase class C family)
MAVLLPNRFSRTRTGFAAFATALLSSGVLAAAGAPLHAQSFPADAEIQAMIDARVESGGAVGIALGVVEADGTTRTFFAGSTGDPAVPLDENTIFEIGSITKVFTGTLLADMARRGEVSLDDPVRTYLPDEVGAPSRSGAEITLETLATHRSGLPRLPSNLAPADMSNPYVDYTESMLYDFLSSYELPRDVDSQAEYSNLGVGLLGFVLSRHLGLSYEEAVRERILAPLAMDRTGIRLTPEMQSSLSAGHDPGGDPVPLWDIDTLAGAGGLRSDLADMLRFVQASVGEPETEVELALRDAHRVRADMERGMGIGLNWITRTTDGQRTVWHNGGTAGFRTFAGFDPDRDVAVVVLTNSAVGADDIGFHLLNAEVALEPPPVPEFALREAVEVSDAVLDRYAGRYQLMPQLVATFERGDGFLTTQLTGQPPVRAYPASETRFFLRAVAAEIEFELDDAGEVVAMVLHQGGQTLRGERIR